MKIFLYRMFMKRKLSVLACLAFIPVLVCLGILSYSLFNSLLEVSLNSMKSASSSMSAMFYSTIRVQQMTVKSLAENPILSNYVDSDYSYVNPTFSTVHAKVDEIIQQSKSYMTNLWCHVYHNNESLNAVTYFTYGIEDALKCDWFDEAALYSSKYLIGYGDFLENEKNYIICYKVVYNSYYPYDIKMVVAIGYPEISFYQDLMKSQENVEMVLISPDGKIVSSSIRELVGSNSNVIKTKNQDTAVCNGQKWMYEETPLVNNYWGISNWKMLVLYPKSNVYDTVMGALIPFAMLTILLLTLTSLMVVIISKDISRRTNKILEQITALVDNNISAEKILQENGKIIPIDHILNKTIQKTNQLMNLIYQRDIQMKNMQIQKQQIEIERKEAVLRSLYNQINPHYFYNMLESIRMKLLLTGDRENSEMIQYFAESLRSYRKSDSDYVTVEEELTFLEQFMMLQKYRLGDCINYVFSCHEQTKKYHIPHMLLQPVLENAVYHGVEKSRLKGSVITEISEANEQLRVCVTDNGMGMTDEELKALVEKITQKENLFEDRSIGLVNVSRRIHLLYGDECRMNIKSKSGCGTEVEILLEIR